MIVMHIIETQSDVGGMDSDDHGDFFIHFQFDKVTDFKIRFHRQLSRMRLVLP